MAETVRFLSAANLSPVFAFLYDEFWCPFLKLHHVYNALLGGRYMWLPAFWVGNVNPKKSELGWKPHRDRGRKVVCSTTGRRKRSPLGSRCRPPLR